MPAGVDGGAGAPFAAARERGGRVFRQFFVWLWSFPLSSRLTDATMNLMPVSDMLPFAGALS
ncbi:MAG: hypothetical protein WBO69_07235 [Thermoanaerobaculia bacterium]